jgi:hypothetical protein
MVILAPRIESRGRAHFWGLLAIRINPRKICARRFA